MSCKFCRFCKHQYTHTHTQWEHVRFHIYRTLRRKLCCRADNGCEIKLCFILCCTFVSYNASIVFTFLTLNVSWDVPQRISHPPESQWGYCFRCVSMVGQVFTHCTTVLQAFFFFTNFDLRIVLNPFTASWHLNAFAQNYKSSPDIVYGKNAFRATRDRI